MAAHDRPSGSGPEVDQEHGEGEQPQRHQVHGSRLDSSFFTVSGSVINYVSLWGPAALGFKYWL